MQIYRLESELLDKLALLRLPVRRLFIICLQISRTALIILIQKIGVCFKEVEMGHTFSIGMGRGQREVLYTEVIYFREFTIRGFTT